MTDDKFEQQNSSLLEAVERIRTRAGLYVGDIERLGPHRLLDEVINNALDEVTAGHCTEICVVLDADNITVMDNGSGIPVEIPPGETKSYLELICTDRYFLTDRLRRKRTTRKSGLHGTGLVPVSALSSSLCIDSYRDGTHYHIYFERGVAHRALESFGATERHGTVITLTPDVEIFGPHVHFHSEVMTAYLQQLAIFNPAVTIRFENRLTGDRNTYHYPGGIQDYLEILTFNRHRHHPPRYVRIIRGDIEAEIALQYNFEEKPIFLSFIDNVEILNEGAHTRGFFTALIREFNAIAQESDSLKDTCELYKQSWEGFSEHDLCLGLVAILSLHLPDPQFRPSPVKLIPDGEEIEGLVNELVTEMIVDWRTQAPEEIENQVFILAADIVHKKHKGS